MVKIGDSMEELSLRIAELERSKRRFTPGVWLAVLIAAPLLLLGAQTEVAPGVVTATEFRLIRDDGTVLGKLADGPFGAELELLNQNALIYLGFNGLIVRQFGFDGSYGNHLSLAPASGLDISQEYGSGELRRLFLDATRFTLNNNLNNNIEITGGPRPSIVVRGEDGFMATLGAAETLTPSTGERQLKTAASLTLFNDEGVVIRELP